MFDLLLLSGMVNLLIDLKAQLINFNIDQLTHISTSSWFIIEMLLTIITLQIVKSINFENFEKYYWKQEAQS